MANEPEVTPELLPCPFCGGLAVEGYAQSAVICNDCNAHGPITADGHFAELWNRRIEAPSPERETARALLDDLIRYESRDTPRWNRAERDAIHDKLQRAIDKAAQQEFSGRVVNPWRERNDGAQTDE